MSRSAAWAVSRPGGTPRNLWLWDVKTVQVTTAVMQYGYRIIEDMIGGMTDYLKRIGADSVKRSQEKRCRNWFPRRKSTATVWNIRNFSVRTVWDAADAVFPVMTEAPGAADGWDAASGSESGQMRGMPALPSGLSGGGYYRRIAGEKTIESFSD